MSTIGPDNHNNELAKSSDKELIDVLRQEENAKNKESDSHQSSSNPNKDILELLRQEEESKSKKSDYCQDKKPELPTGQKEDLDIILRNEGVLSPKHAIASNEPKEFVTTLRRARDFERGYLSAKPESEPGFGAIASQIETISENNRQIENQLKYEIMGIQNKPWLKLVYYAQTFYRERIKGEPFQSAGEIIREQIGKVGNVISDLSNANTRIDKKMERVETKYDTMLSALINKNQNRNEVLHDVTKLTELLASTQEAVKSTSDYTKRLNYLRAHRTLKRRLDEGLSNLKINDRAMILLHDELPLLESLSAISLAYSTSLKETEQEARYLASHLDTVLELYLEMIRSKRGIIDRLENETKKLGRYVVNMSNALRGCAPEVVQKANESELFSGIYKQGDLTLDSVLSDIEDSNSQAFRKLEGRLAQYLNP